MRSQMGIKTGNGIKNKMEIKAREKIKLLIARSSIGIRRAARLYNMLFCRIKFRTI